VGVGGTGVRVGGIGVAVRTGPGGGSEWRSFVGVSEGIQRVRVAVGVFDGVELAPESGIKANPVVEVMLGARVPVAGGTVDVNIVCRNACPVCAPIAFSVATAISAVLLACSLTNSRRPSDVIPEIINGMLKPTRMAPMTASRGTR